MSSERVPSPSLIFTYPVILVLTAAAVLSACGGGGGGSGVAENGNVGAGWVKIKNPTSEPTYQLEADSISLSGEAFISPDSSCCSESELDTGVTVAWTNETTGLSGGAYEDLFCVIILGLPLCEHSWHASVSLALGVNVITVTASDPGGNIGRDTITVTRFDLTPPTVSATSPAANQLDVALNTVISATFSEEINNATVDSSTFILRDATNASVLGTVTYSNKSATFAPSLNLAANTTYTATLTGAITDAAGHALAPHRWSFTTSTEPDITAPVVSSTNPTNGSACVPIDTRITADFSEGMDVNSIDESTFILRDSNGSPVNGAVTYADMTASLEPYSRLNLATSYTATLTTGAQDRSGNSLLADHSWSFMTALPQDGAWKPMLSSGTSSSGTAVWTGSEMIVWVGIGGQPGARYGPATDTWRAISTVNAPTVNGHTAVWTGSEMIVWGHQFVCPHDGSICDPPDTGGRYDPSTDSWLAMSTVNAPEKRSSHTAVWTGSEMIVWGGMDRNSQMLNTGARYNPATDNWLPISTVGAPSSRSGHTAVWTGSEMIVWGGDATRTGGRYDPATDTWQSLSTAGAPGGTSWHTAVWTGVEMIVWGGHDSWRRSGSVKAARYSPSTDTWQPVPTECAPSPRHSHTAVWTGNEMIVWGGYDGQRYLSTGGVYDPLSDKWVVTPLLSAPSARSHHTAVWTGAEMVIWGGRQLSGDVSTGARYAP